MKKRLVAMLMASCVALTTFTVPVKADEVSDDDYTETTALENPPEESNITSPFPIDVPVITPEEYEEQEDYSDTQVVISYDYDDRPDVNNWEDEDDKEEPVKPFVLTGNESAEEMSSKIAKLRGVNSYTDIHNFMEVYIEICRKHVYGCKIYRDAYDSYYDDVIKLDKLRDKASDYFYCDTEYRYDPKLCDVVQIKGKRPSKKELKSMPKEAKKLFKKCKKSYMNEEKIYLDMLHWYSDTIDEMLRTIKNYDKYARNPLTAEEVELQKIDLESVRMLKRYMNREWSGDPDKEGVEIVLGMGITKIVKVDKIIAQTEKEIKRGYRVRDYKLLKLIRKYVKLMREGKYPDSYSNQEWDWGLRVPSLQ